MAFREVRTYFETSEKEYAIQLNREVGNAFTFYMDAVMRGRFASYSGPEVKGLNIVNLFLFDPALRSQRLCDGWKAELNMYLRRTEFDFMDLAGSRSEKLALLLDVFAREAQRSTLPQMRTLVSHLIESRGKASLNDAINKGDEYLRDLMGQA